MKIALIGYGKMGHIIEQQAIARGHEIVSKIDRDNLSDFESPEFNSADIAIEFSTPQTAVANIRRAWSKGKKVVCGTTGWGNPEDVFNHPADRDQTLLWASNFSIGVNIFFAINQRLAELLFPYSDYQPSICETHHIHKLDAPSGTAKTMAEAIEAVQKRKVEIESIREGEVAGIHTITWDSPVDTIRFTHTAKSREGFALGAVIAAEWLATRSGWHTMSEIVMNH